MTRYNTAAAVAAWSKNRSVRDFAVRAASFDMTPVADAPEPPMDEAFADDLRPGTKLHHGQFTIQRYINGGGFGMTYLATDSLDRSVVIKECFPTALCRRSGKTVRARSRQHQAEFRAVVRRFMDEARSLSRMVHPNIVGVHQVFEDNDTAYMAMDYINGSDLYDMLEDGSAPMAPDQVVCLLKAVLGAVGFVHMSGMLHRDISPDNILVDRRGNPFLIDFGAAKEQATKASRAMSQRRVVKDGYSPQEFYLAGVAQGPWSDLYALAATFHHLISGEAPAESPRRLAALAEGTADPYQPLDGRFAGYPPGFLAAVDKAASVLPKDRIQSATDWLTLIWAGEDTVAAATVAPRRAPADPTMLTRARRAVTARLSRSPAAVIVAPARYSVIFGSSAVLVLALGFRLWT